MLKGKCEKLSYKNRRIKIKKKRKKSKRKEKEKKKKKKKVEKIEMKDQNQENESVRRQEMILGLITFKHMLWAYLSFLS